MKTVSSDPCKAMAQMPWPYPQYPPYMPSPQMPPPGLGNDGEFQMRQIHQMHQMQQLHLMHQMMQQMDQMQQMQKINQVQSLQQTEKKADKSNKKDHRVHTNKSMASLKPQVPPNQIKPNQPDGVDDIELAKSVILGALNSLYEDQIMPHHMLVLRRIQEKYEQRWSPQKLNHMCSMIPEIRMVGEGKPQRYNILLQQPPEGFTEFVDQSAQEDTFSTQLWEEVEKFLCAEAQAAPAGGEGWPGSRYEFAKYIRGCLPCLGDYSLGRVCHLVQLCISKKELLGYYQGNLVPYQLSDDCEKKSNAKLMRPTQIQPGEKYVESWEQAGQLLARLLEQNVGTVQLSSLKALFRKVFKMELSESALGHAKLSEFLSDHRLRSPSGRCFGLEQRGTQWHIVQKEFTPPVEPANPYLAQQVSPADWLAPPQSITNGTEKTLTPPPGLVAPPGLEIGTTEAKINESTSQKKKINKIPKKVTTPVQDALLMEAIHADVLNYLDGDVLEPDDIVSPDVRPL
eukprot:gnl/MRDRNA2_/MRDRNA2_80347_c0_seq5.p1 gnl/MRDRNA2_/MRDRNA2_80347_c0~~gnl/MRDRNA2_/MRDRNA2_80347_c0_seq5.p1  ORF type:complete len:512 (-),score=120.13 gnl/MRDRNA2_/MRDRNA2_80347_c0_seq5:168-1703(-)